MSAGVRMKRDGVLSRVDLNLVRERFAKALDLKNAQAIRTARCVVVRFDVTIDTVVEKGLILTGNILIGDDAIAFRWRKLATKHYYHVKKALPDFGPTIEAASIKLWNEIVTEVEGTK